MEYQYPSGGGERSGFLTTMRNSILILAFELVGTMFLTLLYICDQYVSYFSLVTHDLLGFGRVATRLLCVVDLWGESVWLTL